MITKDKIAELFCMADDFYNFFDSNHLTNYNITHISIHLQS